MRKPAHYLAALLVPAIFMVACSGDTDPGVGPDPDPPPPPVDTLAAISSCVGCHTDYESLEALHTPDSIIPTGGCSGPPPYIEPYDRVYLEPAGFASFQASTHGQQECTSCHGGVDGTPDKTLAHSGAFVKRPSFEAISVCEGCHGDMVESFANGLHFNGWGQRNSQMRRAGVESWDELHEGIKVGYEQNCATCHASCGSCHVNRPPAMGGGLLNGHDFQPPDMRDNCTACHSSRGGHAYYGEGIGTKPDVHLTKAGFTCTSCHSTDEMHNADGVIHEYRYQNEALPQCADCHGDVSGDNPYHAKHIDDFNCHTCHSQDYNTCGSCHVAGEGARIHSHLSFKIGLNPLPDDKPYKFSTVRRTLAAPDTWQVFGVDQLADFNDKPIYNYTTPHNIQRWTSRTEVPAGEMCFSACHIMKDGDSWKNRNLYLFSSDFLQEWERAATESVVVDGHLPETWGGF